MPLTRRKYALSVLSALTVFILSLNLLESAPPAQAIGVTGTPLFLPLVARFDQPTATATPDPCGPAPTLLTPTANATLNTLIPTLMWDAGSNANATRVLIEIATDVGFTQLAITPINFGIGRGTWSYQITTNLAEGTVYYWRVTLVCGTTQGASATSNFTSGSGGVLPTTPNLISPNDGATLTYPATLTWEAVSHASQYVVLVQRLTGGNSLIFRTVLTAQYTLVTGDVRPATTYAWKVQAQNAYGYAPVSAGRTFTTDSSWPTLAPGRAIGE